ncbi:NAD(P)H-dependent oxidoreductase [Salinarimonas soli]|uniref:NAD(P)H-dependent oxidoreductase n=1 Tax=Salinarimonas soli TaxID=1638099 RepID=A0A5B2VCN6_9HYPH|nr:NAD(P)H-dependent oxidoreductase [Salinarimonas soli]KAA2236505.1 NAD(P)H-dependent oxidoreductase [Salinarimonas soli]
MRILVLYAHPDPESYVAALLRASLEALARAGHEADLCDLYADGFDPVLSLGERRSYHAVPENRRGVEDYVRRLERAEGLLLVHPVWNFGYPAILKGFLDRVFLPGVSFRIEAGTVVPNLTHLRLLGAVTTYGAPRWRAMLVGDPPRRVTGRMLRVLAAPRARFVYLAHYDMNRSTPDSRARFLARVSGTLGGL